MSTENFRKCIKCNWERFNAKLSVCLFCEDFFQSCLVCGGKTDPMNPQYASVNTKKYKKGDIH
jgi:hypothetical protein